MKKTIYIAGKVTGEEPEQCAQKFQLMEDLISAYGYNVVNPIKLVNNPNEDWQTAMSICLRKLPSVDAIYLLPCSVDSKGAQLELEAAIKLNLDIYYDLKDL